MADWPTITDDDQTGLTGTLFDKAFFDLIKAYIDDKKIVFSFAIPIDTPESTGVDKGVFHFAPGVAGTIEEVYIIAKTAPGATKTLTVDVNKNGTTIFTTAGNRPSLVGTNTEATSGTPDVMTFSKNDKFTIDVDVSTATTAVADVIVLIRGKQTVS